jgi:hypothetical protein
LRVEHACNLQLVLVRLLVKRLIELVEKTPFGLEQAPLVAFAIEGRVDGALRNLRAKYAFQSVDTPRREGQVGRRDGGWRVVGS